ncbi:hypothetical protein SprV_0401428300 [Sparganum proliferum]
MSTIVSAAPGGNTITVSSAVTSLSTGRGNGNNSSSGGNQTTGSSDNSQSSDESAVNDFRCFVSPDGTVLSHAPYACPVCQALPIPTFGESSTAITSINVRSALKMKFFEDTRALLATALKGDKVVVLSDFTVRVGKQQAAWISVSTDPENSINASSSTSVSSESDSNSSRTTSSGGNEKSQQLELTVQ